MTEEEEFKHAEKMGKILKSNKTAYEKKIALFNWLKSLETGKLQSEEDQRVNSLLLSRLYNELAKQSMKEYKKKKSNLKVTMSNLENFESEEEMKGFVLKALEIDPTKKQREFEFIQQGHSDSNPKTKKILERCGGKPEKCDLGCFKGEHHKGISQGRPEYIIRLKDKILIVELKLKSNKHESKKFDEPRSYNVDGALYYSKYFKESFTVIFLAITGQKVKDLKITFGIWRKQQPIYEPLGKKEKEILPWDKYFERLERKPNREIVKKVLKVAENLHNNLRNMSFDQDDKPFFISGCLIALKDKIFHSSLLKNEFDSETETLKHLKSALEREIEGEKYQHLVNELKEALENDSLTDEDAKKEDRLSSVLKVLQRDIFPLIHFSSNFDVIGEFYHEFLRYSGNDEGLGILLTPSHIAEIFTELVVLKPTDKVLDICCGTGTFLVVALSKMSENASPKTLEEAKKNLFGIEKQKKIYRLALTNMILRGDGKSNIIQGSCFKKENLEKLKENGGTDFKVGFLNPPYSQTKYPEGKFILHHLELLEKGGRMAVIVPLKLARGTKQKDWRKKLMEEHTLEAVMTMPSDLFRRNNKGGIATCIMVWEAKKKHNGQTWLANWSDDGFEFTRGKRIEKEVKYTVKDLEDEIEKLKEKGETEKIQKIESEIEEWNKENEERKKENQKEKKERIKSSWEIKKNEWREMYRKKVVSNISVWETLDDEKPWLPEVYLNTSNDSITLDYNELSEGKFIASMKDYLGYIMEISSPLSNSEVYLSKIVEKLEKNPPASFSLEKEKTIKGWKEFSLVSYTKKEKDNNGERETKVEGLFELEEANLTNFHTKKEKKEKIFRKNEKYFPLISTSKVNNGCVLYVDSLLPETEKFKKPITKGNCISFSSFGGFFWQPIDFYRSYAEAGNVWCLRSELLNEKRGLFISALLTNIQEGKWKYGARQLDDNNIKGLKVKLPVVQRNDGDKDEPDWEFMEKYIEYIIYLLSLSLSLEIQFLQKLI